MRKGGKLGMGNEKSKHVRSSKRRILFRGLNNNEANANTKDKCFTSTSFSTVHEIDGNSSDKQKTNKMYHENCIHACRGKLRILTDVICICDYNLFKHLFKTLNILI